jgi:hypothetical protein
MGREEADATSAFLIGVDEAGYGPNLGPLVISATVWQVPRGVRSEGLFEVLAKVVAQKAGREARTGGAEKGGVTGKPVVIADSKQLHQSGRLGPLERGLLAMLATTGHRPRSCQELWSALFPAGEATRRAIPWYADDLRAVPVENDPAELDALAAALCTGLEAAGVRLLAIRSRAIFEEEFNGLVERDASKGATLSQATLGLVAECIGPLGDAPIHVLCDKHGGRNTYAPLLESVFPDVLVEIHGEGRERSVYRFGPSERRIEFRFQAKAESHLPAALASMASKYLRELAMLAFNDFWCGRVAGLRPTAGYPVDARRFKDAIAAPLAELGIDDRRIWRMK